MVRIKLQFLLPLVVLLMALAIVPQPVFSDSNHTFVFSSHHSHGIRGEGAAFNIWHGHGTFQDGVLEGQGFISLGYPKGVEKTSLYANFTLSEPYELSPSGDELTMQATIDSSTLPTFPDGTVFWITIFEGEKRREGWVYYFLPTESGGQSPTTVVIN
ncbi:MAG: hypothetical protein ABIH76_09205 [Candidatus Bathyarchaeota archaeon]